MPTRVVTACVAPTPSNRTNGGLEALSGSNRHGPFRTAAGDVYTEDPEQFLKTSLPIALEGAFERVAVELAPGGASFHDAFVVHGSGPNPSTDWRLMYTAHTIGAAATVGPRWLWYHPSRGYPLGGSSPSVTVA